MTHLPYVTLTSYAESRGKTPLQRLANYETTAPKKERQNTDFHESKASFVV